jgi:hypothetical protein
VTRGGFRFAGVPFRFRLRTVDDPNPPNPEATQRSAAVRYRSGTENWFVYSVPSVLGVDTTLCGELLTGITPQIGPNFYPLTTLPNHTLGLRHGGWKVGAASLRAPATKPPPQTAKQVVQTIPVQQQEARTKAPPLQLQGCPIKSRKSVLPNVHTNFHAGIDVLLSHDCPLLIVLSPSDPVSIEIITFP